MSVLRASGDVALTRAYGRSVLTADRPDGVVSFESVGFYEDRLVPAGDGWVFAARKYRQIWSLGDLGVLDAQGPNSSPNH